MTRIRGHREGDPEGAPVSIPSRRWTDKSLAERIAHVVREYGGLLSVFAVVATYLGVRLAPGPDERIHALELRLARTDSVAAVRFEQAQDERSSLRQGLADLSYDVCLALKVRTPDECLSAYRRAMARPTRGTAAARAPRPPTVRLATMVP